MLKQKITNREVFNNMMSGSQLTADCVGDSLINFFKLRKNGAVRVRGKRTLERQDDIIQKNKKSFHYWVESVNKSTNIVYEEHGGVQQICEKEFYYQSLKITDVEVAQPDMCGFFSNELPLSICGMSLSKWFKNIGDKELLALIKTYIAKQSFD